MSGLPTGTVTFLFTDLEGSTRLWEEHPEPMRAALARHDEILREAVEGHRGHVVKTTGDGLHAVFATAHDAVLAGVDAQRDLSAETWALPTPLRVRMGVHTGEADLREGDYYGTAVNRAARVSAAAHGGQIVVSHATEEVARDHLGALELVDLGEHRLRDLARPERVFQVGAVGLDTDFPPLRSLDAFPSNLPPQLTSFVGREDELMLVEKALEETRLVTLVGVGGVGKTRLATQIAAEVLPRFPDGAWLCELAAAGDPEAMIQVVAATLGVQPHPNVSLEGSILEYLRAKRLLVVLDNCEHLLETAGDLAEGVLRECPGVRILATSREGLAVLGEQVWPLRSLRPPASESVDDVAISTAGRLFTERAQAAAPGFGIDAANAVAVAEICRRLDGIPLAIELAAARVTAMSPTEIARLLDERFRLLTGGRRTAVERHQTLRATVDWSYSLLEPDERLVFERLGVFSGDFDGAAASAVVGRRRSRRRGTWSTRWPAWSPSRWSSPRRRPRTPRASPCSRRSASSPVSSSTRPATPTPGAAATPSTTQASHSTSPPTSVVPTSWPPVAVSASSSTTCAPRSTGPWTATTPTTPRSASASSPTSRTRPRPTSPAASGPGPSAPCTTPVGRRPLVDAACSGWRRSRRSSPVRTWRRVGPWRSKPSRSRSPLTAP